MDGMLSPRGLCSVRVEELGIDLICIGQNSYTFSVFAFPEIKGYQPQFCVIHLTEIYFFYLFTILQSGLFLFQHFTYIHKH